jgi:hypothetical protein
MLSTGEISHLFYGATNALTDFNEVLDEGCERYKCCGYAQGIHVSSAVVRDEQG